MTLDSATLLYTYISRFSVTHHHQQREKILQSCYHKFYLPTAFHSAFQLLAQTATFAFIGKSGYTLAFQRKIAHKGLHGETRAFRMGVVSLYPRSVSHGSETLRGQVSERQTLPLWDLGREVLSKNAESLRDSDAPMRVAVPKASRPRWAA